MVEPGQLRRWSQESDADYGKVFLIIGEQLQHTRVTTVFWHILQGDERKMWTGEILERWSEVVDG